MIEFIWRSDGNIMDELSKFPYSVWLLRALCFGYYYHKKGTAVYPVPRYFFTVNTVDEILSTAHPYCIYAFTQYHYCILGILYRYDTRMTVRIAEPLFLRWPQESNLRGEY